MFTVESLTPIPAPTESDGWENGDSGTDNGDLQTDAPDFTEQKPQ